MGYMKKLLVVGVIVLFLGLSVAPSINANINNDSELVEITTEICGMGGGKHTVQLTKEEAEEVDRIFENIRGKLNTTDSREEAEKIFNEAIMELNRYGLLGGLSVKQVQWIFSFYNAIQRYIDINVMSENENYLCLIAGKATNIRFFGLPYRLISFISTLIRGFVPDLFYVLYFIMGELSVLYSIIPLKLGGHIAFGYYLWAWEHAGDIYPSSGWVYTLGLNGVKDWSDSFYGHISILSIPRTISRLDEFIGATHFIGLNINNAESEETFFIGTALRVKIGTQVPIA